MVTRTEVRKESSASDYSAGAALYEQGQIQATQSVDEDDGYQIIMIEGVISEEKGVSHHSSLEVDEDYSEILESNCDCYEYQHSYGLCKHCVALLLYYIDKRDKYALRRNKNKKITHFPVVKKRTTNGFQDLVVHYFKQDTLPMLQDELQGLVKLEPTMNVCYDGVSVKFKIGIQQMYVLKDIHEFVLAMKHASFVRYGQKLEFYHQIEAFTEESKPYIEFMRNEVERLNGQRNPYTYYYSRNTIKQIDLEDDSMEDFVKAVGKQEIMVEVPEEIPRLCHIVQENPARILDMKGTNEGLELRLASLEEYKMLHYSYYLLGSLFYQVPRETNREVEEFLSWMHQNDDKVFIAKEDMALFSRELLPLLEQHFECNKQHFKEEQYLLQPAQFQIYLDEPQRDMITCELFVTYGEERYNVYETNQVEIQQNRDSKKELQVGRSIAGFFNAYEEQTHRMVLSEDEDLIYYFLSEAIPQLQELGEVYISDALKRKKIIDSPKVTVGVSLSGDLLELSLSAGEMPLDQLVAILSKYDAKKHFYRLSNGDFMNVEEDGIAILSELKNGLNLTDTQLRKGMLTLPKYRALYLDAELKNKQSLPVFKNKEFKSLVRNMKTVEDNDFEIPASLETTLREYQKRGYLWIKTLHYNGFGGILADDMGLGKTIQVISFLLSEYLEGKATDNKNCLIVCPASLVYNWRSEIERFAPKLPVTMVVGTAEERKQMIEQISNRDILITSYDLLKRDIDNYKEIRFHSEIIDEAQFIKNHTTLVAKSVKLIQADFKMALTGTPVENRLSELWSIFDYLMPGFLYGYQRFRQELEVPITQNQQTEALNRLQKMIRPFVLRRLKKDVLTDLPDKMEENMYALMEGEQLQLYDAHVQRMKMMLNKQSEQEFAGTRFQVLAELMKLRQLCCDPSLLFENYKAGSAKSDMCIDLIRNAISGGHKILLFSQFTTMLEHLQIAMREEGISYYSLTGATAKEKRAKLVEDFNKDATSVFCISLKAGGTGLNLTSADIVIHYDPWWNIAVQNQATDRAHRIGQTNVVTVYKLIAKGTIEENIVKLQEAKHELAEQVLGGDTLKTPNFTKEELIELLEVH
ncbi:MAG: SNF2 helicase associated domain-containing protein [Lachnospiraceae bacterium]